MNLHASAVVLAVALVLKGGAGAAPPAPPAASDNWVLIRGDLGNYELKVPPGFTEVEPKKAGIVKFLQYAGQPYSSARVKVYSLDAWKDPKAIESFMKYYEKDIGGNVVYEGDSKSRFVSDIQGSSGDWWVSQFQGVIDPVAGGLGIECLVPKAVYDVSKEVWTKVADSFKPLSPPPEAYSVPTLWKVQKHPMYAILAPVNELKEKKDREALEKRMALLMIWLDMDKDASKLFREVFDDNRRAFSRTPIHVFPTSEQFKKAAGDRWFEGATAIYLPDHPEKVVVVDGSPDGALQQNQFLVEAGLQYGESRIGKMWPWLRSGFRLYLDAALRKGGMAGLFPPEMLKRGKEVFAKNPAPFDELMKADDAGMRALGADGETAAWGVLQAGLHGGDGAIRNLFRGLIREGIATPDLPVVWDKLVVKYKEETKKPFKPAFVDAAAKKYFKELKEEKEKK
jgi:hypothetical protein